MSEGGGEKEEGKKESKAERGGEGRDLREPGIVRKASSIVVFSVTLLLLHPMYLCCCSYTVSLLL